MRIILLFLLLSSFLFSCERSSVQVPVSKCLKAKYGHTVGGTLHAKRVQKKRLINKMKKDLPYSNQEALRLLQKRYSSLRLKEIEFVIVNCQGYYKTSFKGSSIYFDPKTLKRLKIRR